MGDLVLIERSDMVDIANIVRDKTGEQKELSMSEIKTNLQNLQTSSGSVEICKFAIIDPESYNDPRTFYFEKDMTWGDFVKSEYNVLYNEYSSDLWLEYVTLYNNYIHHVNYYNYAVADSNYVMVYKDDKINPDDIYQFIMND